MTTLLNQIRDDQLAARKAKDHLAAALLTTLFSEAAMVGKNKGQETTDLETLAVVKKFRDNMNETKKYLEGTDNAAAKENIEMELAIIAKYMPAQMSDADIVAEVKALKVAHVQEKAKFLPLVMKVFKEKHAGQYDGKQLKNIVDNILKEEV